MIKVISYVQQLFNSSLGLSMEIWIIIFLIFAVFYFIGPKFFISKNNNYQSLKFQLAIITSKSIIVFLILVLLLAFGLFIFYYQDYFIELDIRLDIILIISVLTGLLIIKTISLKKNFYIDVNKSPRSI